MYNNNSNNNNNNNNNNSEDDADKNNAKHSKIIMISVAIILSLAAVYFFVLKDPNKEKKNVVQEANEIIISGEGEQPLTNEAVDINVTDILDTIPDNTFDNTKTQKDIPALPELPELPDSIKQQITNDINIKKEEEEKKETYTKEEVDKIIEERIKKLETEKNNKEEKKEIKDDLEDILDVETQESKKQIGVILEDEEKKDDDVLNNINSLSPTNSTLDLANIQKKRIMAERSQASMFALGGGAAPANSLPQDSDAIILTYADSKLDIESKAPDIKPTQITDLTRTILQGKVINAVLETAIDTDIATSIRAVITRDVFAEEGKNILIPKGSRVIGNYSASVGNGQTRVTINWNRIIRVDGISLNITSIGTDRLGRAGVQGEVDNKYAQRLANTFLSSILSVGTTLAIEKLNDSTGITSTVSSLTGDTTTTSGKASDYALIDAAQDIMDETKDIIDDIGNQNPVIRIPQGERINIMVTQDITLPVFKRGD